MIPFTSIMATCEAMTLTLARTPEIFVTDAMRLEIELPSRDSIASSTALIASAICPLSRSTSTSALPFSIAF